MVLIPPKSRPGGTAAAVLLAWFAYRCSENEKSGGKAEQEASHLFIQQLLRLSTPNSANAVLKALSAPKDSRFGPWIRVTTRSKGARGHHYGLGPAALAHQDHWVAVGTSLFADDGILRPFLYRPLLLRRHRGLALNGTLALAVVHALGPISPESAVDILRHYMVKATAKTVLTRCKGADLVTEEAGLLDTPVDLWDRILTDEHRFGAAERARNLDLEIAAKQYHHQVALLGGPTIARVKSTLRKKPCCYCGSRPMPSGGDVEHFPPIHWGGSDKRSLLLPICRRCNRRHGRLIRDTPRLEPPKDIAEVIVYPGDQGEAETFFVRLLFLAAGRYAALMNERRIADAQNEALHLFPIWLGLKHGARHVDSRDGQVGDVQVGFALEEVGELTGEFAGLSVLLQQPSGCDPAPGAGSG